MLLLGVLQTLRSHCMEWMGRVLGEVAKLLAVFIVTDGND